MATVFDIEKLRSLLRDFYSISRIRIVVFDESLTELVSYPDELMPSCRVIRSTEAGRNACAACDRSACALAAERRTTHIYRCHAGFTEAVTPLFIGSVPAGYLLFGQVLSCPTREEGLQAVRARCAPLGVDLRELERAAAKAELIPEDRIRAAAHLLHAIASYLILERMATLQEDSLAAVLDAYLSSHFTEKLSAAAICRTLHIGRTQLYRLSRELYGCGVAEHLRRLRMQHAKSLLRAEARLPVSAVAERCGYDDYNYFIAAFSRENGVSPGAYRKTAQI